MLVLTVVALMILSALGIGMLATSYGVRHRAILLKNETAAMLAAEAGYERAVFWMGQQQDMLTTLYQGSPGTTGTITFPGSDCDYSIGFYTFIGARPVYRIVSNGHSGTFNRTVETLVVQEISGWAMGKCRIPTGLTTTSPVNYADGEIIDMPLHINNLNDSPDSRDIYISGSPEFYKPVSMGESRYTTGGADKYSSVMNLFNGGIYFNQGDSRVTDEEAVQAKIDRFEDSTETTPTYPVSYRFIPPPSTSWRHFTSVPAVQLEFFVDPCGIGKVRITNDCTVQTATGGSRDYEIVPGSGGDTYQKYNIYSYHFKPDSQPALVVPVTDTYVTQSFGGVESEPGGQIYVKGNVVIGSSDYANMVVKGKITVVAAKEDDGTGGNIWIADSVVVDGDHDADAAGNPSAGNPNVLGLIAQGVVKVINPRNGPSSPPSGLTYQPIGIKKSPTDPNTTRYLPDPTVIEAAITVGGGGWGAENVGSRREYSGSQDDLIVRGAITEACRGAVGVVGTDGYVKKYYLDSRLLEGLLPGDVWMHGKYLPAPAGWHDYRN